MGTLPWWAGFIICVGSLLVVMVIGVPISFSLGLVGVVGLVVFAGPAVAMNTLSIMLFSNPTNFLLVALPLFILLAHIITESGIASEIFEALQQFFGPFSGGLALSTIATGTAFAACVGSSVASTASVGSASLKEMLQRKYSKQLAAGCIAGCGGLAIVIPPSLSFILFGFIAEANISKLFIAGIVPGLITAILMLAITLIMVKGNPSSAPKFISHLTRKERIKKLLGIWPVALLVILILGSIYTGIATISESAAFGVFGALIIALTKKFTWKKLSRSLLKTAESVGFIMPIVILALYFGFLMTYFRIPLQFAEFITSFSLSPWLILIGIMVVMLVMGCFMDASALLLVVVPIILPGLVAAGFDKIWLGVVLVLNIEMSFITPPVGLNLFVIQGIGKNLGITYNDVLRGSLPYLAVEGFVLILVMAVPTLALWLPGLSRM